MTTAVDYPTELGRATLVEECTCPTGYTGASCQVTKFRQAVLHGVKFFRIIPEFRISFVVDYCSHCGIL